ncbi:MAG: hypothetical protein CM1200mP33_2480 [Chloroflexota bacterium]|nr:MAG: hypothetical protein CM1200mP33_2480 [Chloroflexota bacterium]
MAIIRGHKRHSQEPEWFTTANIGAIDKLQKELNWNKDLVDLYEINEAFACVTMAAMTDLEIDHKKLNIQVELALWDIRLELVRQGF